MLNNWETPFEQQIKDLKGLKKAGALLAIIPNRLRWHNFLKDVKENWVTWKKDLNQYPSCLIILFDGLAFYEYDDNKFWPQFQNVIGCDDLPVNQQSEINRAFLKASEKFNLPIQKGEKSTLFISSAVFQIGIPISMWDDFLEICKWACWREDWKKLPKEEWEEAVEKRVGTRLRLRKFLIDNRETASSFILEMLEAREILMNKTDWTIRDITQTSILRNEYFEEVPETAEFLRQQDPESLLQDRARLLWDEQKKQINLYLPVPPIKRIETDVLWRIGNICHPASSTPDELILNSEAFKDPLLLKIEAGKCEETQRLHGLNPWGLFDIERDGYFVNPGRDELPCKIYALISSGEIEIQSREGFNEEEYPVNERLELSDGTSCFITRLWPYKKYAELKLKGSDGNCKIIRFRTKAKIEAQFYVGKGYKAAYFEHFPQYEKIEEWPILCVVIPNGYFKDNMEELKKKFEVFMDNKPAYGRWEAFRNLTSDDKEYYIWRWDDKPFGLEIKRGTKKTRKLELKDLAKVVTEPKGEKILSIKAPFFEIKYPIYKVDRKPAMENCWKNLPGTYLLWFLMCQSPNGMKWDDLVLARDIIAPNQKLSSYFLYKYMEFGFFLQKGKFWIIKESRAAFKKINDQCQLDYCGNPSLLWKLYGRLKYENCGHGLPIIEVIDNKKKDEVPFLRMIWHFDLHDKLERCLKSSGVRLVGELWTR